MSTGKQDIIQLPFRMIDFSDPESMAVAIQRNFSEVERYLSLLQGYIKTVAGGSLSNFPNKGKEWDNIKIIDEQFGPQIAFFTRNSKAYTSNGVERLVNVPRFEPGKFGQAVMVEEGTTNLLTANQSSVETDTTGFYTIYGATISRSTAEAWHGSASLQVQTPGTDAYEGARAKISYSTHGTFTGQLRIKGSGTVSVWLRAIYSDGTLTEFSKVNINLSDAWQLVITPSLTTNTAKTLSVLELRFRTATAQAITFYVDGLQIEAKPYATTWTLGGTTRSPETLTVPTAGVLYPQEWTIECWVYVDDLIKNTAANRYIFAHATSSGFPYPNRLSLMHSIDNKWALISSNGDGQSSNVIVLDTLSMGWHYFSVRWSPSELALFIDGVKVGYVTNPYLPETLANSIYIGCWVGGTYGWCNTLIDDLRISSRARTDQEIAAAYQSGLKVDDSTTLFMSMDGTLRQTSRNRLIREQGTFTIASANTTTNSEKATHIVPAGCTSAQNTIMQAISELPSSGGKIVLLEGTYIVSGGIKIPSNVSFVGSGASTIIKVADNYNSGLKVIDIDGTDIDGTNGVTISDLFLDGNGNNRSISAMTVDVGIYGSWNGVSNCTISNCICSNFFKDGMWIKSLAGTSILACKCNNNSIKGIAIAGPCIVTSCECSNNGWDGINLAESSQASIGHCRCTNNGYRGIDIYAGQNVSITNCDIHQNKYDGIRLFGSSHCIITGNRIEDNGKELDNTYAGIYLGVGSSYTTIQSNQIRKGSSPTQKYGIQIADSYCTGNMVTNNDLYSSGVTESLSDAGTGTITTAGNRL